jgi:transposase
VSIIDISSIFVSFFPYPEDLALAVECIFTWYRAADLCSRTGVEFVLGHALYMKGIHGGKVKNDKMDSKKIAALLRSGREDRFTDPMVRTTVQVDGALMDALHKQILAIERQINAHVPEHDPVAVHLLRTIPGVGKILAPVIFYEIHDINRFPRVDNFISYARLVKCAHESAVNRRAPLLIRTAFGYQ